MKALAINKKKKGLFIPLEILFNRDLTLQEKCLISEIDSLETCWKSNKTLGEFLQVSPDRAKQIIGKLVKKNVLTSIVTRDPKTKQIRKRILKVSDEFKQRLANAQAPTPMVENNPTLGEEPTPPSGRKLPHPQGESYPTLGEEPTERVIQESNTVSNTTRVIPNIKPLSGKPDDVSVDEWEKVKIIVTYLNQQTGKHFKPTTKQTYKLICNWLKQGFTVDDFKKAIDNKRFEWTQDYKHSQYLRPSTLFGDNFESYVNQR